MLRLSYYLSCDRAHRGALGLWRNRRLVRGSGEDPLRRFPRARGTVLLGRRHAQSTIVGLTRNQFATACCFAAHILERKKIMKVYKYCLIAVVLGPVVAWGQIGDIPGGRTEDENGVEVLTRGPVHEAFAETVTFDPEPGIVTPKAPRTPSRNCRRNSVPREPTSPGSPATGPGMTSGLISSG